MRRGGYHNLNGRLERRPSSVEIPAAKPQPPACRAAAGLVKLSSSGRDGGLIVARVMPLRLHGSIARLLLPGRSEGSIERPGGVEG